jgi:Domain of unknown function (DUF222)/HNH endonuclease
VDELSALTRAVDELLLTEAAYLADAARCERLAELRVQIDRLESHFTNGVGVVHERGSASGVGFVTTAAFLQHTCHLTRAAARARVDAATNLREHPLVASAFAEGAISYPHTLLLTRALVALPADVAERVEPILVHAARRLDTARLAQAVQHLRYQFDPDGQGGADERHHEARWLDVATTFDGMVAINGLLDAEAGAVLLTALDAAMQPPGVDDTRTGAQRRADALLDIVHEGLRHGALPDVSGERPHVLVITDLATLRRDAAAAPAQLSWAGPIGTDTARRISCDATVTRVIVGNRAASAPAPAPLDAVPPEWLEALPPPLRTPPLPLDVGRANRLATPAIRKALLIRDRGCAISGCDTPSAWTDAHHIIHWADGGPTSMANMVLLCRRHHRYVHEKHWTIALQPDGRTRFEAPLELTA